jgi:tRNA-splicing ligase RtcB
MKKRELLNLGIPNGEPVRAALALIKTLAGEGRTVDTMRDLIKQTVDAPHAHLDNNLLGPLAHSIVDVPAAPAFVPRAHPAPFTQYGRGLDKNSIAQMRNGCQLPVAVRGALMPDAHLGYGLPIGGVLGTDKAVIPYAVGVDIACRMKLTVLDIPVAALDSQRDRLTTAIEEETRFGIGAAFKKPRQHEVMDADWNISPITREKKDKAWSQLGSSGSGNHFVEFGVFTVDDASFGIEAGDYLSLLSHSGSRGTGAAVADHYSKLARGGHPELPKELQHLSWLDLDSADGAEYWAAMQLMGQYAAANHHCIHKHIAAKLGAKVLVDIENHHNFAWEEKHDGRNVIVHRKGATPAGVGVLGIIPGSMATPAFVVEGKGDPASLASASHGAGRMMSRKKAKSSLHWKDAKAILKSQNVTLLSAGIDEVPAVYKNIHDVMAAQTDLVKVRAKFQPRLVKMAPSGEPPED